MTNSLAKSHPFWLAILPVRLRNKVIGKQQLLSFLDNSGWLLFDKFIRLFLGLAVSAWVARYIGPSQFGELSYVVAYVAFFQVCANLGLDGIVVRDISKEKSEASRILGSVCVSRLLMGMMCWCFAVLFEALINGWGDRSVYLTALIGGVLIFQASDTVDLWFQSQSQSRRTVVAKLIAYSLSSAIKILLILLEAPLVAFAAVVLIDAVMCSFGLFIAYKKYRSDGSWFFDPARSIAMIKESWPYIVSGLSIMVYMRIDQVIIKQILGEQELGYYSAMLPLSTLWHVIPATLCISIAPFLARKRMESVDSYNRILVILFRAFWVFSFSISLIMSLLSSELIFLLYGSEYSLAAPALSVYIFTLIPIFLGVGRGLWMINEGKSGFSLIAALVGGGVSVSLNYLLIPRLGIVGAAWAAVASQFVAAFLLSAFFDWRVFLMQMGFHAKK